jgi:hypothetical protein
MRHSDNIEDIEVQCSIILGFKIFHLHYFFLCSNEMDKNWFSFPGFKKPFHDPELMVKRQIFLFKHV